MQVVTWKKEMSFLSQHGQFLRHVTSIFKHYERMKIFYRSQYVEPRGIDHADEHLLERDCIRSSVLQVSRFGAEDHTLLKDSVYPQRDRESLSTGFERAFHISSFVYKGRTDLQYDLGANPLADIWNFLRESYNKILGPEEKGSSELDLKYSADLIRDPTHDLSIFWFQVYRNFTRGCTDLNKFHVMSWLATLAYSDAFRMAILQMLSAVYTLPSEDFPDMPAVSSLDLSRGYELLVPGIRHRVEQAAYRFDQCPESKLPRQTDEGSQDFVNRKQSSHRKNRTRMVDKCVEFLRSQWPCEMPTIPPREEGLKIKTYIDVNKATRQIREIFHFWNSNRLFRNALKQVCDVLKRQSVVQISIPSILAVNPEYNLQHRPGFMSIKDIFTIPAPSIGSSLSTSRSISLLSRVGEAGEAEAEPIQLLDKLIKDIHAGSASEYGSLYLNRLGESLTSLHGKSIKWSIGAEKTEQERLLQDFLEFCQKRVDEAYQVMVACVSPSVTTRQVRLENFSHVHSLVLAAGQWPRITPTFFLEQLAQQKWCQLTEEWKECILAYGVALTELHRAVRLRGFAGKKDDLIRELQNPGHQNWDPQQYPESLLLEVENGIMIRENQQQIVTEIVDQSMGTNKVMQLNMGEGKSSVIVPILASALAKPTCLVRIIVAKPQSRQMLHILTSKLGGLINRRVYHLPFFRGICPSESDAIEIGKVCHECMESGGVLLLQPEQLLSFELMCSESLIGGKKLLGQELLKTQHFFDESTRDIVDESDENFSTKFELVYAMGTQTSIELSPNRWFFMQKMLSLVREVCTDLKSSYPLSIEVNQHCLGSFPRTRLLRPDAQIELIRRLAQKICDAGMENLPVYRQSKEIRQAILNFIIDRMPDERCLSLIQDDRELFTGTTRSLLLLLRGLLAGGVLAFALYKRWRVSYGLDPQRDPPTKLAVPYRGKDNPTARSEFSDPDIVIMLTCLSYYYEGLSDEDLYNAFNHVIKSDQAAIEYQLWVEDAPALDHQFRQLEGVSLQDRSYCVEHIFPALRYSKGAIDYFLGHIVFSKEMKEFPSKLSASGWDIGRIKNYPTSGFSGTNDSRDTLPLSVEQLDLPEQKHTNALVLGYLLQAENSVAVVHSSETDITDVCSVLKMVTNMVPTTQVILDVGAQILESNQEVAEQWLKLLPENRCQAIVFIDDGDELVVLDRKGKVEPLLISPFAKQIENCHIYLDESHTRGIDIRLPQYYRAAVTLGANLTKDKLVQGKQFLTISTCNSSRNKLTGSF